MLSILLSKKEKKKTVLNAILTTLVFAIVLIMLMFLIDSVIGSGELELKAMVHVMNTDKEEYERFRAEYQQKLRYKNGESYGIPYRSLIPVSFKNVLVAGRCISTDRQMQASVRVMPGCLITGQAAGMAASLACESEDV